MNLVVLMMSFFVPYVGDVNIKRGPVHLSEAALHVELSRPIFIGKWRQKFWMHSMISKDTHSDMCLIEFRQIKKKKMSMASEYHNHVG